MQLPKSRKTPWLAVAIFLLLYVLSVGPVGALLGLGTTDLSRWLGVFEVIYFPVLWLVDRSDALQRLFVWYVSFFKFFLP